MTQKDNSLNIHIEGSTFEMNEGSTFMKKRGNSQVNLTGKNNDFRVKGGIMFDVDSRKNADSLLSHLGLPDDIDVKPSDFIELFKAINDDKENAEPIIRSSYLYKIASLTANFEPLSFIANIVSLVDSGTVKNLLKGIRG